MKVRVTARGFKVIDFDDLYGGGCSLQESSLAEMGAVWFGVDKPGVERNGYTPDGRMHLSQKQVREFLPILQYFANTGYLPKSIAAARRAAQEKEKTE